MAEESTPRMMMTTPPIIHVIMACHNRQALTVRAASAIATSAAEAGSPITITVFDDGSTDGTAEALRALGLNILVLRGDGSAFWAHSMAIAEAHVLTRDDLRDGDLIVWLNDDIDPDVNAVPTLLGAANAAPDAVLVGAMRDPSSGEVTYSGMTRAGRHPLRFAIAAPSNSARAVDTFNGNLVAVPVSVARQLGGIDGWFSHSLADIDYGLRCGRADVPVLLLPHTHGTCARNPPPPEESALRAWRRFTGVKGGGHFASMRRIIRKSHRFTWPLWITATYAKWWIVRAVNPVKARAA